MLLAAPLGVPTVAPAQGLFEKLGLDRLRLSGLGVAYGPVRPKGVIGTESYGIQADYGEIARHWRIFFSASYWGSRFNDQTVNQFVQQLRQSVIDPSADDTIRPQTVRVSDIALEAEGRYTPATRSAFFQPFIGAGLGLHVVNAESPLIANTFVESALDDIASGITGVAGIDFYPARTLAFGVEARYCLLSNVRYGTLRATLRYRFPTRGNPPSTGRP